MGTNVQFFLQTCMYGVQPRYLDGVKHIYIFHEQWATIFLKYDQLIIIIIITKNNFRKYFWLFSHIFWGISNSFFNK